MKKYISIADCSICKNLSNYESGFQKGGREEEATFIPKIADKISHPAPELLGILNTYRLPANMFGMQLLLYL